ncbi:non-homologous end-joining DNA ligase [Phenylobacterium sp.]|uniref:non-homologous end-joining DNA ligase n=1 Tax=Phenylobacterium sp. TaxID=1871053 RepID=UPI0035B455FD
MADSTAERPTRVMGVEITSPGKPLWPAGAAGEPPITKLDYARYLEAVGPWMAPHVLDRPLSVVRAPDGVGGQTFFQRHWSGEGPAQIGGVRLGDDREPYLRITSVEALAALAQIAAVELHPWNCRPGDPGAAGRLVFDFDPGAGLAFDAVVAAATEVRERLAAVGLEGFCRTTGGKGLHVVVPLAPGASWTAAKAFSRDLCHAMAADAPARYVTTVAKAERTGRIFLDYLRNDRAASAVAPLSARARPAATAAMPLTWDQVRPGLDPARYTIRTVPPLLDGLKAWASYEEAERPLGAAIARLAKI